MDSGGAANSTSRLHQQLLKDGLNSKWLVLRKKYDIPKTYEFEKSSLRLKFVFFFKKIFYRFKLSSHPYLDFWEKKRRTELKQFFSGAEFYHIPYSDFDITKSDLYQSSDIIHLHWAAGFLDYPSFFRKNKKPVIWTLHDRGPFSNGLHYLEYSLDFDLNGSPVKRVFTQEAKDLLLKNKMVKETALASFQNRICIVTPSNWLNQESLKSIFTSLPHFVVPYGIPSSFSYLEKDLARNHFNLPKDRFTLLFVADSVDNKRKGYNFLIRALKEINIPNLMIITVGSNFDANSNLKILNFDYRDFGRIDDEKTLATIYSASDFFVIPSIEDNLPNTVLESLCCGTPVIGFDIGGLKDMIIENFNGYLAKSVSSKSLSELIMKAYDAIDSFNRRKISTSATLRFAQEKQYSRIMHIYKTILD
jgi:glycosyltransferase involved in cell wall biosynthesis